jgi:hypothetical protein
MSGHVKGTRPDFGEADLREQVEIRDDFLRREGYRRCDVASCNCGLWHRDEPFWVKAKEARKDRDEWKAKAEGVESEMADANIALGQMILAFVEHGPTVPTLQGAQLQAYLLARAHMGPAWSVDAPPELPLTEEDRLMLERMTVAYKLREKLAAAEARAEELRAELAQNWRNMDAVDGLAHRDEMRWRDARIEELRAALVGLHYGPDTVGGAGRELDRYCDHAAEPCQRCERVRRALLAAPPREEP